MHAAGWCMDITGRGWRCILSSRSSFFYDTVQRNDCRELVVGLHSLASGGIQRVETVVQDARRTATHLALGLLNFHKDGAVFEDPHITGGFRNDNGNSLGHRGNASRRHVA